MKECLIAYGHECETVREAGFGSKKNGELVALADGKWDVLLTSDRNMKHQLNMAGPMISILVILATSNRLPDLLPFVPACAKRLLSIQAGQVVEIGPS